MITIADILQPRGIDLDLKPTTPQEAVFQVASLLKDDERVADWTAFYNGLASRNPCIAANEEFEICIPHARTNAVSSMVMSAGRSTAGILFAGAQAKVHYIFVIGVPAALAADYLRIIGALARIFKDPTVELNATTTTGEFLRILSSMEMKL